MDSTSTSDLGGCEDVGLYSYEGHTGRYRSRRGGTISVRVGRLSERSVKIRLTTSNGGFMLYFILKESVQNHGVT